MNSQVTGFEFCVLQVCLAAAAAAVLQHPDHEVLYIATKAGDVSLRLNELIYGTIVKRVESAMEPATTAAAAGGGGGRTGDESEMLLVPELLPQLLPAAAAQWRDSILQESPDLAADEPALLVEIQNALASDTETAIDMEVRGCLNRIRIEYSLQATEVLSILAHVDAELSGIFPQNPHNPQDAISGSALSRSPPRTVLLILDSLTQLVGPWGLGKASGIADGYPPQPGPHQQQGFVGVAAGYGAASSSSAGDKAAPYRGNGLLSEIGLRLRAISARHHVAVVVTNAAVQQYTTSGVDQDQGGGDGGTADAVHQQQLQAKPCLGLQPALGTTWAQYPDHSILIHRDTSDILSHALMSAKSSGKPSHTSSSLTRAMAAMQLSAETEDFLADTAPEQPRTAYVWQSSSPGVDWPSLAPAARFIIPSTLTVPAQAR